MSARSSVFLAHASAALRDRLRATLPPSRAVLAGWSDSEDGAIRALEHLRVNVVVVDVLLRDGSGFGVLEWLDGRATARPVVVVLTSYAFPQFEVAARLRGADHFVDRGAGLTPLIELLDRRVAPRPGGAAARVSAGAAARG